MAKDVLLEAAQRIAKQMTARYRDLGIQNQSDDIAAKAFKELHRAMAKEEIRNPEAFMTWKIKRLIFDARRKLNVESEQLRIWANEMEAVKGKRLHDEYVYRNGRISFGGLSNNFITREERLMTNVVANAMVDVLPDDEDRLILTDRFMNPELTITNLAHKYGRLPTAMANHLKKLIGSEDEDGALASVDHVMRQLPLATATAFGRIISEIDVSLTMTDPMAGAMSHLEYAGLRSQKHQQQAAKGLAHLRWLQVNRPSNRGLPNKLLNRLIHASCLYVMEPHDARPDQWSDMGLHDDVAVLKAVQKAVAKFSK